MNDNVHSHDDAAACCHGHSKHAHRHGSASAGDHAPNAAHAAHAAHGAHGSGWRGAAHITLHCLSGCAIGELIGLSIGVGLGWVPNASIALAIVLSFVSGFALTLLPLLQRGLDFRTAFATIWLGEAISIATMELVMNWVDFSMGGMRGGSLLSLQYWIAFVVAGIAGFFAAWPVNRWMLSRNMQRCH
ncbi:MAG: hypothetical protein JWR16_3155 [Nevskia sp.]|nr:hypothetical protein [Nevskia sp.]